jgi:hypothetical protein
MSCEGRKEGGEEEGEEGRKEGDGKRSTSSVRNEDPLIRGGRRKRIFV